MNKIYNNLSEYEKSVYDNRKHFTCVRGYGRNRIKQICAEENDVLHFILNHANGAIDGKTMVYAVSKDDMTAHLCNL